MGTKRLLATSMQILDHAIHLQLEGCSGSMSRSQIGAECIKQGRNKLGSTVRDDLAWHAIPGDPHLDKC